MRALNKTYGYELKEEDNARGRLSALAELVSLHGGLKAVWFIIISLTCKQQLFLREKIAHLQERSYRHGYEHGFGVLISFLCRQSFSSVVNVDYAVCTERVGKLMSRIVSFL